MESFGQLLRKSREDQHISVETAAVGTKMTRGQIEALESETTGEFSSNTYFMGHLRNYAEYLKLDAEYLVSLFKAQKLQEAPVPHTLLSRFTPRLSVPLIVFGIALAAGVLIMLGIHLYRTYAAKQAAPKVTVLLEAPNAPKTYRLPSGEPFRRRIYAGDKLIFSHKGTDFPLAALVTRSVLVLETPLGEQSLELGGELELGLGGDDDSDGKLLVFLSDISTTDTDFGAEVHVSFKSNSAFLPVNKTPGKDTIASVIFEDDHAYPFEIRTTSRMPVLFWFQGDHQGRRIEDDYYEPGAQFPRIRADKRVRFWVSNEYAIQMNVYAGGEWRVLGIGQPGRVSVRDIKWVQNAAGAYQLVSAEVE
ncbi:helix-turn-helix domain-containing protein [Treponema endosymbiont of Eucomonympha sp.]|uniref:helix-turn-helix domain-containing protein n=1 Tax=Treponema endosymbiont of Eucomonympha sp. TaxID=1580831 RepID=UPI0007512EC5|nr:helix-turn-helix domain-containing protein [Treponema endosymbiont of Eucomonympha sp.]